MRNDFKLQDDLTVVDKETGHCAGWVEPVKGGERFVVHRTMTDGYERKKVATVTTIRDALAALTTYHDEHPPRWKRERHARHHPTAGYTMFTEFVKWSLYGVFSITEKGNGAWVASRCGDALLFGGKKALFSTAELAKHVVDLHERDGFGNFPAIDDGYSWDGRPWMGPGVSQGNG
jgi:hypothetical protein